MKTVKLVPLLVGALLAWIVCVVACRAVAPPSLMPPGGSKFAPPPPPDAGADAETDAATDSGGAKDAEGGAARVHELCPMTIEGSQVTLEQQPQGIVAMRFTTASSKDLEELRRRVQTLWTVYNSPPGILESNEGKQPQGAGPPKGPAYSTELENTENGARIVFQPHRDTPAEELRSRVDAHVQEMQSTRACPALEEVKRDE